MSIDVEGLKLAVVSAEDIVIAKLLWGLAGESERQLEDAATVVRIKGPELDLAYVERWVRKLQLEAQWEWVRSKVAT